MADVSGSITGLALGGVSFDVPADGDIGVTQARFKNEGVATSGRNFRKMTKQVQEAKSVPVLANAAELQTIQGFADSPTDITISFKTADGSRWTSPGWIHLDGYTTQDSKATLSLFPRRQWELFAAP